MAWVLLLNAWLGIPSLLTLLMLRHHRGPRLHGRAVALHLARSFADHAVVGLGAIIVICLVQDLAGTPAAAAGAGLMLGMYTLYLSVDASMYAMAGLRLNKQLLGLRAGLKGFAPDVPWRRRALLCIGAACAAGTLSAWATVRVAPTVAAQRPGYGAVFIVWALLSNWRVYWARPLPPALRGAWNNRIAARLVRAKRPAAPPAQPTDAALAFFDLPDLPAPASEAYPLWRKAAHAGPRRIDVKIAPDEKPHIVFLFLESFRALEVGSLGGRGITPCFDRLSREGVLWRNFYATGNLTSRAMVAAMYGVLPPFDVISTQAAEVPPRLFGLPHMFKRRGWRTARFCDGPTDWENALTFYMANGFDQLFGQKCVRAAFPQAPNRGEWHFEDEYLMRYHADWLAQRQSAGQPSFSMMVTITNHMPFHVEPHYPDPPVDPSAVDPTWEYAKFLRTVAYTDHCLGLYVDLLRERGLDKNLILWVMADHGQQFSEQTHSIDFAGTYSDALLRVPCILLAGDRVAPQVVDEVASQADIVPTMLDMFDMPSHHHALGRSLLRACETRRAVSHHPWSPAFSSVRMQQHRLTCLHETHRAELYDLATDPQETRDLSAAMPETVEQGMFDLTAVRALNERLHKTNGFCPPDALAGLAPFEPADRPPDLDGFTARLALLQQRVREKSASKQERIEWLLLQHALQAEGAPEGRLQRARVVFHHTHRDAMGELHPDDAEILKQLETAAFGEPSAG